MNSRKEKARQGGWNGGFAPYGYKLENGKLFIIDSLPIDVKYRDKALTVMNKRLYGMYDIIEDIEERIEDLKQRYYHKKILNALKNFDKLFNQMSSEEKRRMMSLIIDTILFHEDGKLKEINFKFPVSKNK